LETIYAENPQTTLKDYQEKLENEFSNEHIPSESSISNYFDGKYIAMKEIGIQPMIRNELQIKEARKAYAEWFDNHLNEYVMVFVDAFNFHSYTKKNRVHSVAGTRSAYHIATPNTQSLNVILAISSKYGLMNYLHKRGTSTANWVLEFLKDTTKLFPNQKFCFVLDSTKVHSSETLEPSQLTFLYLPEYSPQLNPCENVINIWKCEIKKSLVERADDIDNTRTQPHGTKIESRMNILEEIVRNTSNHITEDKVIKCIMATMEYMGIAKHGIDFED